MQVPESLAAAQLSSLLPNAAVILAIGGARTEVHHDNPITGLFRTKRTLMIVARNYYLPGMVHEVKAYTQACLTCQQVRPVRHRPHGNMEPLLQLHGP